MLPKRNLNLCMDIIVMFGYDALSAWLMLIPLLIASFFIIWVIVERLRSKEDDHYDRIEK